MGGLAVVAVAAVYVSLQAAEAHKPAVEWRLLLGLMMVMMMVRLRRCRLWSFPVRWWMVQGRAESGYPSFVP